MQANESNSFNNPRNANNHHFIIYNLNIFIFHFIFIFFSQITFKSSELQNNKTQKKTSYTSLKFSAVEETSCKSKHNSRIHRLHLMCSQFNNQSSQIACSGKKTKNVWHQSILHVSLWKMLNVSKLIYSTFPLGRLPRMCLALFVCT